MSKYSLQGKQRADRRRHVASILSDEEIAEAEAAAVKFRLNLPLIQQSDLQATTVSVISKSKGWKCTKCEADNDPLSNYCFVCGLQRECPGCE